MDTVVLSQLPQECSFLPLGPNSTRRSWHFPPASTQLLLDFFFFFKASFQILCLAGSESVATKHGPRHQDSAARQTGLGTVRSSGTQPHLCKEIAVGLSPSHSSFLCNWESFSTLQWWCEAWLVVLVMEREVLGWKALQMSKGLLLFLDVIAHKCVLFPLNETNLIVHSRNS